MKQIRSRPLQNFPVVMTDEKPSLTTENSESLESGEAQLVQAARYDPTAFEALYQRYLLRVYRYLRLRTLTEEDAADLTQQVFLQALDALPDYRERGLPFSAWLFRIARNLATDAYRRRRCTVTWDFLPEALHPTAGQDPEAALVQRETFNQLRKLLAGLSQDKRELLALRFAGGLTSREIASTIGKSEAAVKKQLSRLLGTLKEQYREYDHEEA